MQPKVSVAIPVYNTERYIRQCLDSIVNQTLKGIEIILVDDGSTDNSGAICDEYAAKDSRVKVIHKANGGLSTARQVGLEASTGEYYTVCDSDDWVELDMYEEQYRRAVAEGADMVICSYFTNYPDGREIEGKPYNYTTQKQYIIDVMSRRTEPMTVTRLIKRELFSKYDISYQRGINLGEDALILYKLLMHPLKITMNPKPYYHYRRDMSSGSYTNNVTMRGVEQLEFIDNWKREHLKGREYEKVHTLSAVNLCFAAIRAKDITKQRWREVSKRVSVWKTLRSGSITLKSMFVILSKIVGLAMAKRLFKLLYPLFYK